MKNNNKKILIGCEESQAVTIAFRNLGYKAYSCDLEKCSGGKPQWHIQDNVCNILNDNWFMAIFFPPCTYLSVCQNRHIPNNPERWKKQFEALELVYNLLNAPIRYIALENPVGVISTYIRKPDQIIHPYYFGDNVPKKTCLWLKNLPVLEYSLSDTLFNTQTAVTPEYIEYNSKKNKSGKSKYSVFGKLGKGHGKERSVTFPGIAKAMATQWSKFIN